MKNFIMSKNVYKIIRWILASIFLYAGILKLSDPKAFGVIIEAYGLIPESWVMPVAIILPALEVIAATGLLLDTQGSLAVITGLLMIFIAILGYGIYMGLDVDCGCFGPEDPEARAYADIRPALYRDLIMMAGVLYLYFWRFTHRIKLLDLRLFLNNYLKEKA